MSLHLSICQIVGNYMSWLKYLLHSSFQEAHCISVDVQAGILTLEGRNSYDKTHFMSLYRQVVHKKCFKVYLVDIKFAV